MFRLLIEIKSVFMNETCISKNDAIVKNFSAVETLFTRCYISTRVQFNGHICIYTCTSEESVETLSLSLVISTFYHYYVKMQPRFGNALGYSICLGIS